MDAAGGSQPGERMGDIRMGWTNALASAAGTPEGERQARRLEKEWALHLNRPGRVYRDVLVGLYFGMFAVMGSGLMVLRRFEIMCSPQMEAAALMCVLCFLSVSFTHKRPGYRGYAVIALRVCYGLISAFVTPICEPSSVVLPSDSKFDLMFFAGLGPLLDGAIAFPASPALLQAALQAMIVVVWTQFNTPSICNNIVLRWDKSGAWVPSVFQRLEQASAYLLLPFGLSNAHHWLPRYGNYCMCAATVAFLQVVLGWGVPVAINWLLDRLARRRFLFQRRVPSAGTYREQLLANAHLLPSALYGVLLALVALWQVVQLGVAYGIIAPAGPSRQLLCHVPCTTWWRYLVCPMSCYGQAMQGRDYSGLKRPGPHNVERECAAL